MLRPISILLSFTLIASQARAEMPSLAELESRIASSTAMQVLDARYDVARLRLESEQRRQGASLYSSTTFSDNDEVVDVGRSRSYRQLSSGIGVRVPVLGSRMQWRETVASYELALVRQDSERELRRRELLRDLRKAYATYWSAQRLEELSRRYLDDESAIEHALTLRANAGLLLDSDRLEFMSAFTIAHRDEAVASNDRKRALDSMRMLVNGPIAEGVAVRPLPMTACTVTDQRIAHWAERAPEVEFLAQAARNADASERDSALFPVNADIRAGYHSSTEWPSHEQGGSAAVTLSFEVPINFLSQRRLQQASAAAERSQAQLEYELRRAQVEQDLRTLLRQRAVLERSLQVAAMRLSAADQGMRERELRAAKLAGDVIEQLQQARLARYVAGRSSIDAELALAHWSADWAMYAPEQCRTRALYVWSSESLLERLRRAGSPGLDAVGVEDVTTLLISLDAEQIERYRRDGVSLRSAIQEAHARGLKAELLLGEPTWMLPEHRGELIAVVRGFAGLPFDGLHLDLEPNQLEHTGIADEALLHELLETLRAVRSVSTMPVDLSVHPKYLLRNVGGRTLGDQLSALGMSVTLMIYVSNPERVVEIAEPMLNRHPNLPLRIALSTEESLDRDESLYYFDPAERMRRIERIEQQLRSPNFHGITLQPAPSLIQAALGDGG